MTNMWPTDKPFLPRIDSFVPQSVRRFISGCQGSILEMLVPGDMFACYLPVMLPLHSWWWSLIVLCRLAQPDSFFFKPWEVADNPLWAYLCSWPKFHSNTDMWQRNPFLRLTLPPPISLKNIKNYKSHDIFYTQFRNIRPSHKIWHTNTWSYYEHKKLQAEKVEKLAKYGLWFF